MELHVAEEEAHRKKRDEMLEQMQAKLENVKVDSARKEVAEPERGVFRAVNTESQE